MLTLSFARTTDKNAPAAYISNTRNVPSISCHVYLIAAHPLSHILLRFPSSSSFIKISFSLVLDLFLSVSRVSFAAGWKNEWAEWNGRVRCEEADAKVAQGREWKHRSRKLISKLLRQERIGLLYHARNIHHQGSCYSQRYPGYEARCF